MFQPAEASSVLLMNIASVLILLVLFILHALHWTLIHTMSSLWTPRSERGVLKNRGRISDYPRDPGVLKNELNIVQNKDYAYCF